MATNALNYVLNLSEIDENGLIRLPQNSAKISYYNKKSSALSQNRNSVA